MAFFEGGGGRGSVVRVNPSRPAAAAKAAYSPPPSPPPSSFAQLSHVMAQARAQSGHPEGGAMGQPRATPKPQNAQASPAAERVLQMVLSNLWRGADQPFMAPTDPIARSSTFGLPQSMARQAMVNIFNQDFSNLKNEGLIPSGTKEPPIGFPAHGYNGDVRSFERGGKIYFSPVEVAAATTPNSFLHAWASEVPIHELAHTLQSPQTLDSVPVREGGAQAFADAAVPRVVGPIPTYDTNYSGYVRNVRASKGPQWFMRGQFSR